MSRRRVLHSVLLLPFGVCLLAGCSQAPDAPEAGPRAALRPQGDAVPGPAARSAPGGSSDTRATAAAPASRGTAGSPEVPAPTGAPATTESPGAAAPTDAPGTPAPQEGAQPLLPAVNFAEFQGDPAPGPGLLVALPQHPSGASRDLVAIADACSMWLHFWVSGQGECPRTPLWASVEWFRKANPRPGLRLAAEQAPGAASFLGITHVVVARLSGTFDQPRLEYQLVEATTKKPVGGPIVLAGARKEVFSRLLGTAQELCRRLGMKKPYLPDKVTEEPGDFLTIGRNAWSPTPAMTDESSPELTGLMQRSALGALCLAISNSIAGDDEPCYAAAMAATQKALVHPLAYAEGAFRVFLVGSEHPLSLLSHVEKTFPENSLVAIARVYDFRTQGRWGEALQAARKAVQLQPKTAEAWLALHGTFSAVSNQLREGRFINEISDADQARLNATYAEAYRIARRMVEVAPRHPEAWSALSGAAAHAGDEQAAHAALQKWVEIEAGDPGPDSYQVYQWGPDLCHPKWFENPAAGKRLAERAAVECKRAGDAWTPTQRLRIALRIHLLGHRALARTLARDDEERRSLTRAAERNKEQQVEPPTAPGAPRRKG